MSATQSPPRTDLFTRDKLYIAGEWVPAGDRPRIPVINPYTAEEIGSIPQATVADVDAAISAAVTAHTSSPWQRMSYLERGEVLARIGEEIIARSNDIVEAYVHDFGGLRAYGQNQAIRTAGVFTEHLEHARHLHDKPQLVPARAGYPDVLTTSEPCGPVLAIVPWNGTLMLTALKVAPALLAGCPIVVKLPPEAATVSWIIAEAIEAAGVPAGMVSFLPGNRAALGDISARPEFRWISFTGSTASGTKMMQAAAENIAGVTLELGGKSAVIVLDDIDPESADALILRGSLMQSGQVCTTYSRVLIPKSRETEWLSTLTRIYDGVVLGDPNDPLTTMGPVITEEHRASIESYIQTAKDEGATILAGGNRPARLPGYFVSPTLIADVKPDMTVVKEEVFGPVTVVQTYEDLDEAVAIANDSDYGLAAGVFTNNEDLGVELALRLQAGNITINGAGVCNILPFGGYKKSGLGREGGLQGVEELLEFKQIQLPRKA
ncbi:aldehyde dehydrogenase family protein [Arthrobacter sp. SAFR-044]|uniref:aldehyde dehydrogenase family protein n=1 Tax=Arthrobacter sp. SAFR-044 TaxID=3387278 RepID=UPI003F7B8DB1